MWKILLVVSGAGAAGGLLNALMSNSGIVLPHLMAVAGSNVLVPGFFGNVLVGGVAAVISFGLYGPFSNMAVLRTGQSNPDATPRSAQLTLAALAGAALVGYSGSRWITAEADKQFNHGTAVTSTQLAEKLAASKDLAIASRSMSPGTPSVTHSQVQSLARAVTTRSPREAYEEASNLESSAR